MLSIRACMVQPTATSQQIASSTGRALCLRHRGSIAIGSKAAIARMATAAALISLN
jgi:hypothetical protein